MFLADKPSPPEGPLEVSNITKESCKLAWRIPVDDGGAPILHYIIEKMDISRGTWSDAGMTVSLFYDVPRLIHRKEYLFRVKAVNSIGKIWLISIKSLYQLQNGLYWSK